MSDFDDIRYEAMLEQQAEKAKREREDNMTDDEWDFYQTRTSIKIEQ